MEDRKVSELLDGSHLKEASAAEQMAHRIEYLTHPDVYTIELHKARSSKINALCVLEHCKLAQPLPIPKLSTRNLMLFGLCLSRNEITRRQQVNHTLPAVLSQFSKDFNSQSRKRGLWCGIHFTITPNYNLFHLQLDSFLCLITVELQTLPIETPCPDKDDASVCSSVMSRKSEQSGSGSSQSCSCSSSGSESMIDVSDGSVHSQRMLVSDDALIEEMANHHPDIGDEEHLDPRIVCDEKGRGSDHKYVCRLLNETLTQLETRLNAIFIYEPASFYSLKNVLSIPSHFHSLFHISSKKISKIKFNNYVVIYSNNHSENHVIKCMQYRDELNGYRESGKHRREKDIHLDNIRLNKLLNENRRIEEMIMKRKKNNRKLSRISDHSSSNRSNSNSSSSSSSISSSMIQEDEEEEEESLEFEWLGADHIPLFKPHIPMLFHHFQIWVNYEKLQKEYPEVMTIAVIKQLLSQVLNRLQPYCNGKKVVECSVPFVQSSEHRIGFMVCLATDQLSLVMAEGDDPSKLSYYFRHVRHKPISSARFRDMRIRHGKRPI